MVPSGVGWSILVAARQNTTPQKIVRHRAGQDDEHKVLPPGEVSRREAVSKKIGGLGAAAHESATTNNPIGVKS